MHKFTKKDLNIGSETFYILLRSNCAHYIYYLEAK